jgi:Domain of unknown function (DUF5666)
MTVKRVLGLIIGMAFVAGTVGSALAQGQPAAPKEDKKAEKPAEMKKSAAHNASGTVKMATPDSLVVAGKAKGGKDAEWTFSVDPKTKIRKAGKDITAADLAAGDAVHVRYHEQGGKNVADAVMVRAAKKAPEAPKATDAPKTGETKK